MKSYSTFLTIFRCLFCKYTCNDFFLVSYSEITVFPRDEDLNEMWQVIIPIHFYISGTKR